MLGYASIKWAKLTLDDIKNCNMKIGLVLEIKRKL